MTDIYAPGSKVRVKANVGNLAAGIKDTWVGVEGYVMQLENESSRGIYSVKVSHDPFGTPGNTREGATFRLGNLTLLNGTIVKAKTDSAVEHPAHYGGDTTYEVIKVIEAWGLGFVLGNVVKYVARAGKKPGNSELQDLKKARDYINKRIEKLEEN